MWPFSSQKRIPDPPYSRFPPADEQGMLQWLWQKCDYFKEYYPEDYWKLFSPTTGDYLPIAIHVASSWNEKTEYLYRMVRATIDKEVLDKAMIETIAWQHVGISRVGYGKDFPN